jgi:hypothetical protein
MPHTYILPFMQYINTYIMHIHIPLKLSLIHRSGLGLGVAGLGVRVRVRVLPPFKNSLIHRSRGVRVGS